MRSRETLGSVPAGGILICDTNLRVTYASGNEFDRFGNRTGDLIGQRLPEIVPHEHWRRLRPSFDIAAAGRTSVLTIDVDDELFAMQISPILEEGIIGGILAVSPDAGELKRLESLTGVEAPGNAEERDRILWSDLFIRAIRSERFTLHAQPIQNLATGEIEQHELLIRLRDHADPDRMVPPGAFLPDAERLGLIPIIDRWVISQAIEISRTRPVEINVSAITISDPDQVIEIEREIAESGAPPENLTFEITETAVAENLESARRFAEVMRKLGCSFALDDFGVGFGTFTYLKHLPVDFLKIDMEFVRDLLHSDPDRQVVAAIVGAARLFKMKTIAEGVEDQETLDLLGEMNVDYAQGYWIGRPGPITG